MLALTRALDVAVLGESTAQALGLRSGLTQIALVILAAVLTAVAVGLCGPIAFVGILAGGLARAARPRGHLGMLAVALPWGAAILLAADVAGRAITGLDTETPAGVVCALIGAPVLVIVARRLRGEAPAIDRAGERGALAPARPSSSRPRSCRSRSSAASAWGRSGSARSRWSSRSSAPGRRSARSRSTRARRGCASRCSAAPAWPRSGTVLQAAVRNPFAGPELAGVVGGASVGAFVVLLLFPGAPALVLPFASFAGALIAMGIVLALAGGGSPARLALTGLAVTAACSAVTALMLLHAQPAAATAITWLTGSTYADRLERPPTARRPRDRAAAALAAGGPTARRPDARRRPRPRRSDCESAAREPSLLAAGAALGAAAVAVCGAIAFIGLLAPHAARLLAGGNHRRALPMAIALGALLLALADTVGRTVLAPTEIPSGLVVVPDRRAVPGDPAVAEPDGMTLRAQNLTVGYGDRDVLRGLDCPLPEGQITAIVGANASGKSTLLQNLRAAAEADRRPRAARRRRDLLAPHPRRRQAARVPAAVAGPAGGPDGRGPRAPRALPAPAARPAHAAPRTARRSTGR